MLNRSTLGQLLIGGVMAALVFACTADAVQSTSTPNAALIPYSLGPGAYSLSYAPASNQSTLIMGNCTTPGFRAVGQVTVLRLPNSFLTWVGINSSPNGTVTQGFSGTEGNHVVQIDYDNKVFIEVGNLGGAADGFTRDTLRVHNTSTGTREGNTTWIW